MIVPKDVIQWFTDLHKAADSTAKVLQDALASLREELAAIRAERDALKLQAAVTQTHFDWLKAKVNQLEMERAGLIEKAYQIRLPAVPEVMRTPISDSFQPKDGPFNFDDVGEELAKQLGLPLHDFLKS